jgi:glucokinase
LVNRIGVDFGGTRIKAGLVDGGVIRREAITETHAGSTPDTILDAIASIAKSLDSSPQSVGVAIPGEADAAGHCYRLPNVPGFEGFSIGPELSKRIGCPVTIENDATTAALGEKLFGHGRTHASFAMITLGTGVGGGVVIDRKVRRGRYGFAGELGHVPIDRSPSAPVCTCGLRGCVESWASSHALLARAAAAGSHAPDVRTVAEAAKRGDRAALSAFEEMGVALAWMVTAVQNTLDLDAFVFSGGISASFDLIEPSLRRTLRERAHAKPLGEVPLLVSEMGDRAGIVGAAHLHEITSTS